MLWSCLFRSFFHVVSRFSGQAHTKQAGQHATFNPLPKHASFLAISIELLVHVPERSALTNEGSFMQSVLDGSYIFCPAWSCTVCSHAACC